MPQECVTIRDGKRSISKLLWLSAVLLGAAGLAAGVYSTRPETSSREASEAVSPQFAGEKTGIQGGEISFNRDIRPILSDKCFACHGPDANVAEDSGGFRLDIREGAIVPAEASGAVPIIPGDAEGSELVKRLLTKNPNRLMPPPSSNTKLTDEEIALLQRWIDQGAEYQGHWAYETPQKPALPEPKQADWVRNSIDRFVAYRLEKAGLSPSADADRETLIRRLSLDLIGLPPTPEQIDAFLNDGSPDAYEKLVDRLLASPHFGERMAILWMDAARYADTNGFHHDNIRTAWPWRQWVIEAFNSNMPYDQFVTWQLAGDLLPNATQDQILASAFCRMHNINDEGGALNEEYLVEAHADRIETIGTVFMAQTFNCARCHDHKYDPTTQSDYFSMVAFFNSVEGERGVYQNNFTAARAYPPYMIWQTEEDKATQAKLELKVKKLQDNLNKSGVDLSPVGALLSQKANVSWVNPTFKKANANKGVKLKVLNDGSVLAKGRTHQKDTYTLELQTQGKGLRVIRLDALRDKSLPKGGLGRSGNGNAVLSFVEAKAVSLKDASKSRDLSFVYAHADYAQEGGDYAIENALNPNPKGWAVGSHLKGGDRRVHLLTADPFGYEGGTKLVVKLHFKSIHPKHSLGRVRINAGVIAEGVLPEQSEAHFAIAKRIADVNHQLKAVQDRSVPVLIMKESARPKPAYILDRGTYDKPIKERVTESGEVVPVPPQKRTPPSMVDLPMPEGAPENRLGFAMWLTQPEHPLTSRVHVNRLWKLIFGTGIVATVEDFGSQAEWPSHPGLLDYLAVDFVENGWDQKALIKKIVMSATYRQQAVITGEALEKDADNRLLSYFPRRRMPAELIRDNALFASGLLGDEIGGPSVKPYQPGDLWFEVAIGSSNTMHFKRDAGDALYRRSLYTFWKKTSPPAQMATFNAPTREFCVVNRDVTNTPLQALVLWNDEQFLEAARVLAQRTIVEAQGDDDRLTLIFRRCTGRVPNAQTIEVLRGALQYYRKRYQTADDDAKALLEQGDYPLPETYDPAELASFMMVSSSVLSLDETIVRD